MNQFRQFYLFNKYHYICSIRLLPHTKITTDSQAGEKMYLLANGMPIFGVLSRARGASLKGATRMLLTSCSRWRGEGTWDDDSEFTEMLELDVEVGRVGDCWKRELMSEAL